MSGVIAKLWAEIGVDTNPLKTGLVAAKTELSGLSNEMKRTGVSASGLVSAFGTVARGVGLAAAAFAGVEQVTGKLIGDFQDYTLSVGDLSRKLGVTTEAASGLMEMSADLGVETSSLQMAFRTMANKGIDPSIQGSRPLAKKPPTANLASS